ncbi:histone-lysine N-methyltransferase set-1-like [Symsagittifera roscoffensis]|uniref:histone-lysine N-methyltransferase set-1-like n=1 Tax=Symsagittifera roscoffensis TaxID=84072 RepID=UPI00307C9929
MDSELPAVNTAQLETPVFHRDHNEPPSSQQSVTNRCSTSRSFDQNFAQHPSVEVPLGTPIRPMPYAEPCTIITDVNHNDNTYHTLETPQQVSSRKSTPSNQHSSTTLSWEIPLFTPQSATATQADSSSTEPPTDSSSENMAKRVIPTNNDSQTERNKWETHHDLKKVMSQIAMLQKEKSKRQQKPLSDSSGISYKGTGNFLSLEAQTLLAHRCVVSTQAFQKDDIIMDYHGVAVTDKTYQDLIRNRSVPTEFVLEIGAPVKRFIDASSEVCVEHPTNRCLGRLANHSTLNSKKNLDANMKIIEVVLNAFDPPKRLAVFKARRNIEPFEQLRYDYGDKVARYMFNM